VDRYVADEATEYLDIPLDMPNMRKQAEQYGTMFND
jgi:hypothetical protein